MVLLLLLLLVLLGDNCQYEEQGNTVNQMVEEVFVLIEFIFGRGFFRTILCILNSKLERIVICIFKKG